jgi:hypothetical protein
MPELSSELALMAENITGTRARPIVRRFNQLLDALERARARYAICGAIALGAHGAERFTKDIDVLVADADLERVVAELASTMRELGREPTAGATKQVRLRSKRARTDTGVDIDLMAPIDAVEAWALATGVRAKAFGRRVDIVSPEALVLMKLRAYLSDPESGRGGQHRVDAMTLLSAAPAMDLAMMRRFVRESPELRVALEKIVAAPPPRGRLG